MYRGSYQHSMLGPPGGGVSVGMTPLFNEELLLLDSALLCRYLKIFRFLFSHINVLYDLVKQHLYVLYDQVKQHLCIFKLRKDLFDMCVV